MIKLSLKALIKRLKKPQKTLIFCHKNPDPDTLGSAFALKMILEALGSQVVISDCDKPNKKFDFITGGASLTDKFDIDSFERVIAIDVASPAQLGANVEMAGKVNLIIDHHESCTRFADYYEDFAPACAMIVYDIAKGMRLLKRLDLHFFECVYAALSGDTGCFKYSNTNPRALEIAADIIKRGIDFARINHDIFDSLTIGEISAQRMVYDNMAMLLDGRFAIIFVTNEMKARYGVTDDDISDIVNTVRQIQGTLVAVSVKQSSKDNGTFFVSSRANVDIDVSRLCASLGGGGHVRAAGATITASSPEEAYERVKNVFSEGVVKYVP